MPNLGFYFLCYSYCILSKRLVLFLYKNESKCQNKLCYSDNVVNNVNKRYPLLQNNLIKGRDPFV